MAGEVRTAVVAGAASIIVTVVGGFITYETTQSQVASQLQTASLTHAKDIAAAVHDSLSDLLAKNDPGRVKTTLVGLYFLGANADERKQIIETAGSAETPQIRSAISYVLSVDRKFGSAIAADPDVLRIVVLQNAPRNGLPTPAPNGARETAAIKSNDQLDQTISLLNGTGWVYLGLGPDKAPVRIDRDTSIEPTGSVVLASAIKFTKNITLRDDAPDSAGLGSSLGTIKSGETGVILHTKSYAFREGVRAVWGEVFLCAAPQTITRPREAAACPSSPPAVSTS